MPLFFLFLIFINVCSQDFIPSPLIEWVDSDRHQNYAMLVDHLNGGGENGVDFFQTYGPMYRYLHFKIGPMDPGGYYLVKLFVLSLYGLVAVLFAMRCGGWRVQIIIAGFFALFNFPSIVGTPLIMLLWSLAYVDIKEHRFRYFLHLALGVSLSVILSLYKPSHGVACLLQVICFSCFAPDFQGIKSRVYYLGAFFLLWGVSCLGLYVLITDGNLWTLIRFAQIALSDTLGYAHWNLYPLEWPNYFTRVYPIIILVFFISLACLKILEKRVWLALVAFPLVFVDFKHSYVRADITNIGAIFAVFPLALFLLWIRFKERNLRILCGVLFIGMMAISCSGLDPYNTPYRHPRLFFIGKMLIPESERLEMQQRSLNSYEEYMNGFQWVKDEVKGKSLWSIPSRMMLSELGRPLFSPGHQTHYGFSGSLRHQLDLEFLEQKAPDYILYDNKWFDYKTPLANGKELYLEVFSNYDLVQSVDPYYLLKKTKNISNIVREDLFKVTWDGKPVEFEFETSSDALIAIKTEHLVNAWYRLEAMWLKGDRAILSICEEEIENVSFCNHVQMDKGIVTPLNMKDFAAKKGEQRKFTFKLESSLLSRYPMDPGSFIDSTPNQIELTIELLHFRKNSEN